MGVCARLALSLGFSLLGCQDGYPIAPTACDDWAETTKCMNCYDYDPADCVSDCEEQELASAACRPQFDAALTCYRNTPGAVEQRCVYVPDVRPPCEDEFEALQACGFSSGPSGGPFR